MSIVLSSLLALKAYCFALILALSEDARPTVEEEEDEDVSDN